MLCEFCCTQFFEFFIAVHLFIFIVDVSFVNVYYRQFNFCEFLL